MKTQNRILMHKNKEVALISLDERGFISEVNEVYEPHLLPCYISKNKKELKLGLQRWLFNRELSRTRSDFIPLRSFYGDEYFLSKNKVSLFDCYWLKVEDDATWESENYFNSENWDYESDSYFDLLYDPEMIEAVYCDSPNLTIPGCEHRFWYYLDGQLGIISLASQKEMKIYKKALELGIEKFVAKRKYVIIRGHIYTFIPVSTSEKVERVPFDVLYDSVAKENASKTENLAACCKKHGLTNWKEFFTSIIHLDEALGNKERNLCEFFVLRDTDTLEILGFELI